MTSGSGAGLVECCKGAATRRADRALSQHSTADYLVTGHERHVRPNQTDITIASGLRRHLPHPTAGGHRPLGVADSNDASDRIAGGTRRLEELPKHTGEL